MVTDLQLAALTDLAYRDDSSNGRPGELFIGGSCLRWERKYQYSANEVEVVVFEVGKTRIIIPRGTEFTSNISKIYSNWIDLVRNLLIAPAETRYGCSHYGYALGADNWLRAHRQKINWHCNIILTGHSLGAAVSVHIAQIMWKYVDRVVLFGEPRSMGSQARLAYEVKELASKTTSYMNQSDWVRFWCPGYRSCETINCGPGGHGISKYIANLKLT